MGHFSPRARKEEKKEKKSSLALTRFMRNRKVAKKRHPSPLRHFFIPAIFFVRRRREMQCPTRFTHWHWQAREESLSSSTLTEGGKKVDKPRRIELPSSYIPPKIFFLKKIPTTMCVPHSYYKRANNRA